MDSVSSLAGRVLAEHDVDVLINDAGRSIRRSADLREDRFHDYERTMAVNYFGAVKLTLLLASHMRERGHGHITNVSSLGVPASAQRYSAYVASKAALDAFHASGLRRAARRWRQRSRRFTCRWSDAQSLRRQSCMSRSPPIGAEEAADMICEIDSTQAKQEWAHASAPSPSSPTRSLRVSSTGYCSTAYQTFPREPTPADGPADAGEPARGQARPWPSSCAASAGSGRPPAASRKRPSAAVRLR